MKKRVKISYNAPVILSFVLLCFIVTIVGILTNDTSSILLFSVYRCSLSDPLGYVRLFTHVLGHDGIEHFVSNAMYLLLLGPLLEEKYGSKAILKIILITAVVTGVVNCAFFGDLRLCGASGIVFAFIILSSFTIFEVGEIPLSFILVTILFIGGEFVRGITVIDNISNISHILGGIVGGFFGYIHNKKEKTFL